MAAKALSNITLHHEEARLLKVLQTSYAEDLKRFCTLNEAVGRCIRAAADAKLGTTLATQIASDRNLKTYLPYAPRDLKP